MTLKHYSMLRTVPCVITMGTIFYLSHQPGDSLHLYPLPGIDKLAHFVIYGLLAGTVIFAASPSSRSAKPGMTTLITVCICLLYGITDELHQSFIPLRETSIFDIIADFTGAAVVCLAWYGVKMKLIWKF